MKTKQNKSQSKSRQKRQNGKFRKSRANTKQTVTAEMNIEEYRRVITINIKTDGQDGLKTSRSSYIFFKQRISKT